MALAVPNPGIVVCPHSHLRRFNSKFLQDTGQSLAAMESLLMTSAGATVMHMLNVVNTPRKRVKSAL